jgi:hypothetical protein
MGRTVPQRALVTRRRIGDDPGMRLIRLHSTLAVRLGSPMLVVALACGADDSDGTASDPTIGTTAPSTTIDPSTSSATTDPTTSTMTTEPEESSSGVDPSTSVGPSDSSSTDPSDSTGAPACDPVVPGIWASCIDEMGDIDNTLCMWMGTGESVGMVSCLSAASNPDANTCFIRGCKDACDCFAPPATGTAPVVCDSIVEGGEMGCALACGNGETCPDGMECIDNLCFWPPA